MEEIISQEELDHEAVEFASEHCQRDKDGKPVDYQSLYYGFKEGAKFVLLYAAHPNFTCYNCHKTTSDVVYVMIANKDNTVKQVPICQECYNKLMKE